MSVTFAGSPLKEIRVVEKKTEMRVALSKPTPKFSGVFTQLLKGNEITSHIWSYLTPKEVGISFSVSKLWKEATSSNFLWSTFHKRTFSSENKVPPTLNCLSEICKTHYLETQVEIDALFQNKIGVEFYSEYLGEVKAPPIPLAFITRAKEVDPFDLEGRLVKDTHLLVYVPKEITITVPTGSHLILKEGRLIEDLQATSQTEQTLIVPVTISNLSMLTDKCLKKGHVTGVNEHSHEFLLKELRNKPIEAHFSYLRKDVVGLNNSYQAQSTLAKDNHYEVSSLIDRVLLNLLTFVSTGAFISHINSERTSASIVFNGMTYQPTFCALSLRLQLFFRSDDSDEVGVAVGVPSESSSTLGSL